MNRAGRFLATCALAGALGGPLAGCVAAAIPVVAMGVIGKKQIDGPDAPKPRQGQAIFPAEPASDTPPSRTPVFAGEGGMRASLAPGQVAVVRPATVPATAQPAGLVTPAADTSDVPRTTMTALTALLPPSAAPPAAQAAPALATPAPEPDTSDAPRTTMTGLTALPPPSAAPPASPASPASPALVPAPAPRAPIARGPVAAIDTSGGYLGLVSYAISRAGAPDATSVGMAIDPSSPLGAPRRGQCGALPPAVLIDLDPGVKPFDPSRSEATAGLAEALAAMRSSGVTVLWASALQVGETEKVRDALARSGLDPARTDRLLLLNGPGDRKQARRANAARNWCVVAMAGDRRGDFDESYDYLRNPDATIPADALFGAGWFVAPPPLP